MKQFIGTKIIKAKEMNLGDYNQYRGWKIPDNEDPEREGYLVEYDDNYQSWSPKETFEEAYVEYDEGITKLSDTGKMMNSKDYKERFKAEYHQLGIRFKGLQKMLEKWDNDELEFTPTCSKDMYEKQVEFMEGYLNTLGQRALLENIEL